jgi:hypothetical protein
MSRWLFYCLFGSILLIAVLWLAVNGLGSLRWFRSSAQIQAGLLADVPLGSSYETVRRYIESQGFKLLSASKTAGYLSKENEGVGRAHLFAELGGYRLIFTRTDVAAYFGFDGSGRLLAVDVRKYNEGP